jgi:sulfate transport system ATP-binding protein
MPHATPLPPLAGKRVAVLGSPAARAHWLGSPAAADQPFILLETSNPDKALEEADLIVVLDRTTVEQIGTPHEVYHHPASERVLKLFGPANSLRGRLEFRSPADGGRPVFCSLDGEPASLLPNWLSPAFDHESGVVLIVRPHDLEILAEQPQNPGGGGPYAPARVSRIHSAGPLVKVTLAGDDGAPWTADVPHAQYQRQPFGLRQNVFLRPRAAYVFPVNYEI